MLSGSRGICLCDIQLQFLGEKRECEKGEYLS